MQTNSIPPQNEPIPLFSAAEIQQRITELGAEISRDYAQCELHLVGIMKGAFIFMADLARALTIPCVINFLYASSYGSEQTSSGHVRIEHDLDIHGKHVLLIEDIVDTGLTVNRIVSELQKQQPASVKACVLLDKAEARKFPADIHYTGFRVPKYFVVGYGIDFNEHYRELPYVARLED
ncbi:MAG: hypoxanthine phosphoribosyltransferase [Desulfobacteraceae bacterium]|nr:hypoxanthine phosphoribosyltransferase [Desulfobacteraceae bacterium]